MIDTPQITRRVAQEIALIKLTVPSAEIQNVMGPGIGESMATGEARKSAFQKIVRRWIAGR